MPRPATRMRDALPVSAAAIVALLLSWRIVAGGLAAIVDAAPEASVPARDVESVASWRSRIADDPTDVYALIALAWTLEGTGAHEEARSAVAHATALAPADPRLHFEAARLLLRLGEERDALGALRRVADLDRAAEPKVWPMFAALLDARRQDAFFLAIARDPPAWWARFFVFACSTVADTDALRALFAATVDVERATPQERACAIDRLQREGRWTEAYQVWLDSLPVEQRGRVGHVFNGDFEAALSGIGFDWIAPRLEGVVAEGQITEGAHGTRALRVAFVNTRYAGSPVYQYLMLPPGRYRFEGMGRPEGLETWVGLQWGLYCAAGEPQRQLAKSTRFLGSDDWSAFQEEFAVDADCSLQVLRLELANPRRDADRPGAVAARLRGVVWFDDLRVVALP